MPSATLKAIRGLFTSPNPFSAVPEGALLIADEVVTRDQGVLTPRRGMPPSVSFAADRSFPLPTTSKALTTSRGSTDPTLFDPDTNTAAALVRSAGLSTQLPVSTPYASDRRTAIQAAQAKGNLYFTTRNGAAVVPGIDSPPWRSAGLPPPFVSSTNLVTTGSLTFATGLRRTYRVTLAMYDELGNFIEGPPSEPTPVDNSTGGNTTPALVLAVPLGCPPTAFFRIWRALEVPAGTISADEMFLIQQADLPSSGTGADGFAAYGTVTVLDTSIDSLLTIPLYTNPLTGDGTGGIAASNIAPPAAGAIAWFKGRMYYGRPSFRQSLEIQIIGTGAGGMQSGDFLTVGPLTLIAGTDFTVATAGGQVAQNVETTARNIVAAINNAFAGVTAKFIALSTLPITRQLRAQYISLGGTDFGRFQVERPFPAPLSDDPDIDFSASSAKGPAAIAVAVGTNVAASSSDAQSFLAATIPTGTYTSAVFGGTTWVAVGGVTKAATSTDGITWVAQTIPAGTYNAVAWSGSVFAAVGNATVCATSPDGVVWTSRTIPAGAYSGITWNGSLFVAVGTNVAATSPDGVTWTARTIPAGTYAAVAWNGALFAAVGALGVAATSPTGTTWTARTLGSNNARTGIAWNGTVFLAVGTSSGTTSPDGITWTLSTTIPAASWRAVAWSGSLFMMVGTGPVFATSPDGITFTTHTFPSGTYSGLASIGATGSGIAYPSGIQDSTDDYAAGNVAWSKVLQPEAVPGINVDAPGDPAQAVLAFSVHRDVMLMWTEAGVWTVVDNGGPEPIFQLLDASVNLLAPASAAVVDNISYAVTARGLLQVSEQGTISIVDPILTDLQKLITQTPAAVAQAYGVSYDSERLYILGIGSQQYVLRVPDAGYPPSPPQWTRWRKAGTSHGMVLPQTNSPSSDRLIFVWSAQPAGANLLNFPTRGAYVERKGNVGSLDFTDFVGSIANPGTTTTNVLVFPDDVHAEIFSGDLFTYNPGGVGTAVYTMRVLSVDGADVTLDASYPFTAGGTLTYYRGIQHHWRYTALALDEPTAEKLWESVQLHFDYIDADWVNVLVDSNKVQFQTYSKVYTDPLASSLGGTVSDPSSPPAAIGTVPWLRLTRDVVLRVDPSHEEARAARIGIEVLFANALSSFRLTAVSAATQETKERSTR